MFDPNNEEYELFQDSGSEYILSTDSSSEEENQDINRNKKNIKKRKFQESDSECSDSVQSVLEHEEDVPALVSTDNLDEWVPVNEAFTPRQTIPSAKSCSILIDVDRSSSPLDIFFKVFPKSLFIWISAKTNERLEILMKQKKKCQFLLQTPLKL